MPSLVAVLDSNFWLATHVTTITIGYAAGLLASAFAHVWILGKLLGYRRGDKAFYETVSQMTYGVLCFGLLFALVGTMLGGIWANYSWGRFWGWDPKENAALMICLWQIAMLCKGERRGLIAFKVIGVGADPDGGGSVLPSLFFEIVAPVAADVVVLRRDVRTGVELVQ